MDWALLDAIDEEGRGAILAGARRRRFARGEVVFHEGDPADTVHLVERGHFAARTGSPRGDSVIVMVFRRGDCFGEMALIAPGTRSATVRALERSETLSVHRDVFDALRARHPGIDRALLAALTEEVRRLTGMLVEALHLPVETRVWRRISELADHYDDLDAAPIPLTQTELAELAGTTRQTLNALLKHAEAAGVVQLDRGRVRILDADGVRRLASG